MMRFLMWVLWPSFLTAIVACGLFFSAFDPQDLAGPGHLLELSRMGTYTVGFLFFWAIGAIAAAGSCWLGGAHMRLAE